MLSSVVERKSCQAALANVLVERAKRPATYTMIIMGELALWMKRGSSLAGAADSGKQGTSLPRSLIYQEKSSMKKRL